VTRQATPPEDDRRFAPLAWGLALLCFVLAGGSIALDRLNHTSLDRVPQATGQSILKMDSSTLDLRFKCLVLTRIPRDRGP
jgi:hypothetical protein